MEAKTKGIQINSTEDQKKEIAKLLKTADFDKCDLNQLVTVINLFDVLEIPMKKV